MGSLGLTNTKKGMQDQCLAILLEGFLKFPTTLRKTRMVYVHKKICQVKHPIMLRKPLTRLIHHAKKNIYGAPLTTSSTSLIGSTRFVANVTDKLPPTTLQKTCARFHWSRQICRQQGPTAASGMSPTSFLVPHYKERIHGSTQCSKHVLDGFQGFCEFLRVIPTHTKQSSGS